MESNFSTSKKKMNLLEYFDVPLITKTIKENNYLIVIKSVWFQVALQFPKELVDLSTELILILQVNSN